MIVKNGTYTRYKGLDFALSKARQEAPIPFTHFIMVWNSESPCPLNEFELDKHGNTLKIFNRSEVKNAFHISTKIKYLGSTFSSFYYYENEDSIDLNTYDTAVAKELNFVTLTDSYGKSYYSGMVKLSEVDGIWEERTKSEYDLPMPQGLAQKKVIYIP
jgi:hypothetical protein